MHKESPRSDKLPDAMEKRKKQYQIVTICAKIKIKIS